VRCCWRIERHTGQRGTRSIESLPKWRRKSPRPSCLDRQCCNFRRAPQGEAGKLSGNVSLFPRSFQVASVSGQARSAVRALVSGVHLELSATGKVLCEHGWSVDHTSIFRWVQRYGPEVAARCRAFLKPTNRSYRTDETYSKVKGKDCYLYRAADSTGQTINFLLAAQRDKASVKRFLRQALRCSSNRSPRVINVDKNRADPAAVQELKAEGVLSRRCRLRQCKF
jgi:IS6 family transposase